MKTKGKWIILFACIFFFLSFKSQAIAVTVTINNYPSTITDESFTVTASVSGATAGTNYLRIDIFKDQTTNYFGETFNGSDWYGGSTYSQYLPVTIQSTVTWNGSIQGRIGSPSSTDYDGSGTYKIRLRRYTGGGGYTAIEANNSAVVVTIALPTSTPTPSPTPTLTPVPTNTPTPTSVPTPTKTPIPTPTPTLKTLVSPTFGLTAASISSYVFPTSVLGESTSIDANNQKLSDKEVKTLGSNKNNLPKILISIGAIFLLVCGILAFKSYREKDNPK